MPSSSHRPLCKCTYSPLPPTFAHKPFSLRYIVATKELLCTASLFIYSERKKTLFNSTPQSQPEHSHSILGKSIPRLTYSERQQNNRRRNQDQIYGFSVFGEGVRLNYSYEIVLMKAVSLRVCFSFKHTAASLISVLLGNSQTGTTGWQEGDRVNGDAEASAPRRLL